MKYRLRALLICFYDGWRRPVLGSADPRGAPGACGGPGERWALRVARRIVAAVTAYCCRAKLPAGSWPRAGSDRKNADSIGG